MIVVIVSTNAKVNPRNKNSDGTDSRNTSRNSDIL